MNHMFDVEVAKEVGIIAAVIFQNIAFWCQHSEANGLNFHEGRYWTYNSVKAMREMFPYLSKSQIDTAVHKLIDAGLVVKGNFNKSAYDRTTWYAMTENGKSIFQKSEMESQKIGNGFTGNRKPIPDINTDIDTDTKQARKRAKSDSPDGFEDFWKVYPRRVSKQTALKAWMKLKADETLTRKIIEDVRCRIEGEWRGRDVQYIPHPTTYLNQRRWEDEGEQSSEPVREWNDMTADEQREAMDSGPFGKWY